MKIDTKLEERQGVIETLQALKQEKEKIEESVKVKCENLFVAFRSRERNNIEVQILKEKRNKAAGKGNKSRRNLKKQFTELEHR